MAVPRTAARAPAATTGRSGGRRSRAGCSTGSSTGCWRQTYSRSSRVPTRRSATAWLGTWSRSRAALEGRLAQVERKIASIIRAVEDGLYQPSMKERMGALEAEKARLVAKLAAKADTPPVALHPNLPALYRKKVEELEAVLADTELGAEAMEAIRSMITRIVLTPSEAGGMEAVLEGDLAQILTICEGAERKHAHRRGGVLVLFQ